MEITSPPPPYLKICYRADGFKLRTWTDLLSRMSMFWINACYAVALCLTPINYSTWRFIWNVTLHCACKTSLLEAVSSHWPNLCAPLATTLVVQRQQWSDRWRDRQYGETDRQKTNRQTETRQPSNTKYTCIKHNGNNIRVVQTFCKWHGCHFITRFTTHWVVIE